MICNECGKEVKPGQRIWECTVGIVEEDLDGEHFFEPTEHTDHRCPKCMGEDYEEEG